LDFGFSVDIPSTKHQLAAGLHWCCVLLGVGRWTLDIWSLVDFPGAAPALGCHRIASRQGLGQNLITDHRATGRLSEVMGILDPVTVIVSEIPQEWVVGNWVVEKWITGN
jgi:hypothetical protein